MLKASRHPENFLILISITGILFAGMGLGIGLILSPVQRYYLPGLTYSMCVLSIGVLQVVLSLTYFRSANIWGWILGSGLIDFFLGAYLFQFPATLVTWGLAVAFWTLLRVIIVLGSLTKRT